MWVRLKQMETYNKPGEYDCDVVYKKGTLNKGTDAKLRIAICVLVRELVINN